jgi:hypothetical protein
MAALPDNINLNPETVKEHLIVINQKIDTMMEGQVELSETLCDFIQRTNDWIKCHDESLHTNLRKLERHDEKIDQLEKKVNTWNITNSLGAIIAGILAAIGIKGS